MNLQVIAGPRRDILWVSGALPGSVHDKKAEWIWGVLGQLEAAGLVTLADKGYPGSTDAKIPYKGKNKPDSQKQANKAHAKLRAPGERANAQLKTWKILTKPSAGFVTSDIAQRVCGRLLRSAAGASAPAIRWHRRGSLVSPFSSPHSQ